MDGLLLYLVNSEDLAAFRRKLTAFKDLLPSELDDITRYRIVRNASIWTTAVTGTAAAPADTGDGPAPAAKQRQ